MAKKTIVEKIKETVSPKTIKVSGETKCANCDGKKYCYKCSDPKVVDRVK